MNKHFLKKIASYLLVGSVGLGGIFVAIYSIRGVDVAINSVKTIGLTYLVVGGGVAFLHTIRRKK